MKNYIITLLIGIIIVLLTLKYADVIDKTTEHTEGMLNLAVGDTVILKITQTPVTIAMKRDCVYVVTTELKKGKDRVRRERIVYPYEIREME